MQSLKFVYLIIAAAILSSCGNVLNEKAIELTPADRAQENQSLDFEIVKQGVFSARCVSCHQQYSHYQGVLRELSAIQAAVTSNRMPKSGGPLSDSQKATLTAWINQGAPEQIGVPPAPSVPDPLLPTWKSLSEKVIFPKCLACHNPNGQAKFLVLANRQSIFDNRNKIYNGGAKFIDIDFPEKSYLLEVLNDEEDPMPPAESNIARLTTDELKTIQQWISLGLPF